MNLLFSISLILLLNSLSAYLLAKAFYWFKAGKKRTL